MIFVALNLDASACQHTISASNMSAVDVIRCFMRLPWWKRATALTMQAAQGHARVLKMQLPLPSATLGSA